MPDCRCAQKARREESARGARVCLLEPSPRETQVCSLIRQAFSDVNKGHITCSRSQRAQRQQATRTGFLSAVSCFPTRLGLPDSRAWARRAFPTSSSEPTRALWVQHARVTPARLTEPGLLPTPRYLICKHLIKRSRWVGSSFLSAASKSIRPLGVPP